MDFFTVPTISFTVLYCFFVISQDRRRILHFNVTKHPTSLWVVEQLQEAFPFESASRFLLFDRDGEYAIEFPVVRQNSARLPACRRIAAPLDRKSQTIFNSPLFPRLLSYRF